MTGIILILAISAIFVVIARKWHHDEQKNIEKIKSTINDHYENLKATGRHLERRIDSVYHDANSYADKKDSSLIQLLEENNKKSQEELLKKIALLEFKIDNPAKYKIGDKAPDKGWVVTNVECKGNISTIPSGFSIIGGHILPEFNAKTHYWSYTSTNIKTGEVKTWAE